MLISGVFFREGFSNYDPIGALNAMASQRTKEARGGELQINELLPASLDAAKSHGLTERDVYEATDYYKTPRGQQPGGATKNVVLTCTENAGPGMPSHLLKCY